MSDPLNTMAQLRKRQYEMEFADQYHDRRDGIHADDDWWCTDVEGAPPCERCAPLVQRYNAIRATMPKLIVWCEDTIEKIMVRWWKWRHRKEEKA